MICAFISLTQTANLSNKEFAEYKITDKVCVCNVCYIAYSISGAYALMKLKLCALMCVFL